MAGLDRSGRPAQLSGTTRAAPGRRRLGRRRSRVLDEGRDFDRGERWGVYNIQRLYLDFLEALGLREETVPGDPVRRELVFYQLGKFSQVISDFEQIYFNTEPRAEVRGVRRAGSSTRRPATTPSRTPTSATRRRTPSTLATVHQAKGMQWPAVFLPCLRKNRFPSKRQGGLSLFHVIPETAIGDPDRYRGTVEDETRLFYVAVTRAQKYLFVSFSPGPNQLYRRRSVVLRPLRRAAVVLDPRPRACRRMRRGLSPRRGTRRRTSRCRSRS